MFIDMRILRGRKVHGTKLELENKTKKKRKKYKNRRKEKNIDKGRLKK